ncbi:MAG: M28 family peptidase [Acidobacteriota bacterium]
MSQIKHPDLTSLIALIALVVFIPAPPAWSAPAAPAAGSAPLLPASTISALAEELSGEAAKRNLELLSRQHRMRGSHGFHAAAEFIAGELRSYGLSDAAIVEIPADGKIFYGTQRSRRPWDAEFAELWELGRDGDGWVPRHRLASWDTLPLSLAQDSESADVTAELVDVGAGTSERDYAGRDVKGRIVLVSSQPEAVEPLAVERFGAAGMVSYAQNQRTAWWGEDENLVRWGHVGSFNKTPSFAFMASLKTARALQARLAVGETIRLHATVRAGQHDGHYDVVSATLPGSNPTLAAEDIVFSCHLDHPRPGANDNASGCATILEVARTLGTLVHAGRLARPARTLRWIFPPRSRGHALAAGFPSGDHAPHSCGDSSRHGGRRAGDQGDFPRHARTREPALVHPRCRRDVR